MKIIVIGSRRQGHWQPMLSAILATAGLLISLKVVATFNIALVDAVRRRANWYKTDVGTQRGDVASSTATVFAIFKLTPKRMGKS